MKPRLAHSPTTTTRKRLFKRQAPNDMKKGDLIAKWWIITDPDAGLGGASPTELKCFCFFRGLVPDVLKMHEAVIILYSQKTYDV